MKIMISGGLGFIGSHLAEDLLKSKHEIIILTKNLSKKKNILNFMNKLIVEKVDVSNFKSLKKIILKHKPDVIIHLAGNTSHSKSFENPFLDIDSNTKSTLNFLEIIRISNLCCKFILGSTFIVIGKPKKLPVTETTECNPTTLYGVHRLTSEYYCKIYHNVYDINTMVFRITNSFGPREQIISTKNAINYLIFKAYKGDDISIYNKGNFFRDLIYVSDVISGIKTIVKKGKSGHLYWISSGRKTWFYEIGDALKNLTTTTVCYVPSPKYTKKVDVGNFVVDNSKLRKLGWTPKVSIEKGIVKTLDYFKSQK
jgi:nucleoside-diphosphate-sugar epimerase